MVACYRVVTVLLNVENEVCHPFREIQAACRERRVARDILPQCLMHKKQDSGLQQLYRGWDEQVGERQAQMKASYLGLCHEPKL